MKANRARITDLATLAIAAFNGALMVHWLTANFWVSLLLWTATVAATILALAVLDISDYEEGNLVFTVGASLIGGVVAWLLV